MECATEEEYAPVADTSSRGPRAPPVVTAASAARAKAALLERHAQFLDWAGAVFVDGHNRTVEISPLASYAGEALDHLKGRQFPSNEQYLWHERELLAHCPDRVLVAPHDYHTTSPRSHRTVGSTKEHQPSLSGYNLKISTIN